MNNRVAVRICREYDIEMIIKYISEIYKICEGPDVSGKRILVKPNILTDTDPEKCVSTHPVVVEAVILFLISQGAKVYVGDSPSIHFRGFKPVKSGIYQVCERTGSTWVDFTRNPSERKMPGGEKIKIASIANEVDLIISLPKFKNHELVYFTGAIKNTLGLVPGFTKAKQHALHQNRINFSRFLVDLNKTIMPHFFIMDGITGMEGPGPGQGTPVKMGILIGSSNPVALDVIATSAAGYDPMDIPTTSVSIERQLWLNNINDIVYNGPVLAEITRKEFRRIPVMRDGNISYKFLSNRLKILRKLERRPVFVRKNCTGCLECIKICPVNALVMHPVKTNHVVLTDRKCIRCFCCSEVCQSNAVKIKRKLFGV